ncbi:phosphate ABC transporter, permease protein PstA [Bifidobacterium aemilianum]|uniref:Phosphate transport system permease protein PstA n=2 Tax=Bifidobacterium aemilianum TaxID=2493120 RepID=A0A366K7I0_9BIFI|nr:phosphate ABC transporter, permease protein PstA [Bifidobacterium aemilianum]
MPDQARRQAVATAGGGQPNRVQPSGTDDAAPVIDFDKFKPTRSFIAARKRKDLLMRVLVFLAFLMALIPLISVLWTTLAAGIKRLNWNFLTYNMSGVIGGLQTPSGGYGGIEHAIIGTLEVTLGAMVISVPIGLMCAVYLVEYAHGGRLARAISLLVDVMSGIPSIVAGLFAFSMFSIVFGPGTINGFEGSVALSLLMIPTVVKSSEEMLRIVPGDLREAAYALGVTKQRTITKIVLRTALPGIVSGVILAIARVIGETAPLLMTAGFISSTNLNLFSGQMTTLPVYVYQEYSKLTVTCPADGGAGCVSSIPMERAWAAALTLIILVLVLNLIGRLVARVFSVKTER